MVGVGETWIGHLPMAKAKYPEKPSLSQRTVEHLPDRNEGSEHCRFLVSAFKP
jgi:hypothetical protein